MAYYHIGGSGGMQKLPKTQKLLDVAGKSLDVGDIETAKSLVVLAMQQEDAVDALDRLLPHLPEVPPEEEFEEHFEISDEGLSESQVARILALTRELKEKRKFKIVNQILAKIERIEANKKRRKK